MDHVRILDDAAKLVEKIRNDTEKSRKEMDKLKEQFEKSFKQQKK